MDTWSEINWGDSSTGGRGEVAGVGGGVDMVAVGEQKDVNSVAATKQVLGLVSCIW